MRLTLIAAVMAAGCSYSEPTVGGGDTGPDGGGNVPPNTCPTSDSSLRLCLQFSGPLTPTVTDGMSHVVAATNLTAMTRAGDPAAHLDSTSEMFIAPIDASDLDNVTNLTIEMWIAPDQHPMPGQTYWMLDNNTEYGMEYRDNGTIRCVISDKTVDGTAMVATTSWTHVACTYDQSRMIVLVNGAVDNCTNENTPIPTNGTDGVAIGANLGLGPVFNNRFIGGLDNVHVYDRALSGGEICTLAGHGTSCPHRCPGGGDD
jgi:hypothetical protein